MGRVREPHRTALLHAAKCIVCHLLVITMFTTATGVGVCAVAAADPAKHVSLADGVNLTWRVNA